MQCPVDQAQLVMTERQGVEIDYCPVCRGIWLDRGELDKIIDRAAVTVPAVDPRGVPGAQAPPPGYDDRRRDRDDDRRRDAPVYGTPDYGTPAYGSPGYDPRQDTRGYDSRGHDPRGHDPRRKKKKESWLEDLFDF